MIEVTVLCDPDIMFDLTFTEKTNQHYLDMLPPPPLSAAVEYLTGSRIDFSLIGR